MNPLVSLIIAVYEHEDFLEKVLVSLKNQTFSNFEIIVADDGSGPLTKKVIDRFSKTFTYPIQHIWHPHDGFRKTIIINKATTFSQAEYLVFIDGDCILHHRFIEYHFKRRKPKTVLAGRRVKFTERFSKKITLDDIQSKRIEKISFWYKGCRKNQLRHGLFVPGMFFIRNIRRNKYSIVGSNFSVHKKDYYFINGYDERIIGRGLEDDNLWARFVCANITVKTMVYEAVQYHLFHTFKPIPHDAEMIKQFRDNPASAWTDYGIIKSGHL